MLKMIAQDVGPDTPSHTGSGILIETVVDPAVYPGVIDIVSHLRERGVVEGHVHQRADAGQGDGVVALAVDLLKHRTGGEGSAGVVRRVARVRRRVNQREPFLIRLSLFVAVSVARPDG